MKAICVIPARYSSIRLVGKPLRNICGKAMICHVYDRVKLAKSISNVIVATDDQRIIKVIEENHGCAVITNKDCRTGTDRVAEVVKKIPDSEIIINVQGDEPLIDPDLIDELVNEFDKQPHLKMVTVATEISDINEIKNPNNVKIVVNNNNEALYFSRSPIPFFKNTKKIKILKHIGVYGYERSFLLEYAKMDSTPLELAESLEQLRVLENGFKIRVIKSCKKFIGVDTEEDLKLVNKILCSKKLNEI